MEEESLSPLQSIELITRMIDKTKNAAADSSVFFLLWGWVVFIACLLQYFLKNILYYEHHYYAWLLIIAGFTGSIYYSGKQKKTAVVKTYISESIEQLWMGIGICFFVLAIVFSKIGYEHCFPFYILFYAIGCFVTGRLIKFYPLIWGGIGAWILAILSAYVSYDANIMLTAAAILISYIIPGYLLRKEYKKASY